MGCTLIDRSENEIGQAQAASSDRELIRETDKNMLQVSGKAVERAIPPLAERGCIGLFTLAVPKLVHLLRVWKRERAGWREKLELTTPRVWLDCTIIGVPEKGPADVPAWKHGLKRNVLVAHGVAAVQALMTAVKLARDYEAVAAGKRRYNSKSHGAGGEN